ncbi:MAG TPA: hypothetical protein VFM31_02495 [Nitrososphaeraceae archaeon]|nr:hypothetical protein [Nitrososphaeraceae archaeon]
MNRTLLAYILAAIISFSTIATITMQPISSSAQTQQAEKYKLILYIQT